MRWAQFYQIVSYEKIVVKIERQINGLKYSPEIDPNTCLVCDKSGIVYQWEKEMFSKHLKSRKKKRERNRRSAKGKKYIGKQKYIYISMYLSTYLSMYLCMYASIYHLYLICRKMKALLGMTKSRNHRNCQCIY